MKVFAIKSLFCLIFCIPLLAPWDILATSQNVITDPRISGRCDVLIQQRQKKVQLKHKAKSLVRRTEKLKNLIAAGKEPRALMAKKLHLIETSLNQEVKIYNLQITSVEEDIIRRGCPGVSL